MKKFILSLFSALLSLAMILPGATAVVADPGQEGQAQLAARKVLVIKAPPVAEVNQAVTMTIVSKHDNKPVPGAAVYAVKIGLLTVKSDKPDFAGIASDYLATAKGKGILLGNTDTNGVLTYKFTDSNRYLLIASIDGYIPGFSRISITNAPKKGLNIKAPGSTEVGKPVTLAVTETFGGSAVAGTSIYARKIRDIISLPFNASASAKAVPGNTAAAAIAPTIKANIADFEGSQKKAAEIKEKGFLLGTTGDNGELIYTFKEAAVYELAAIKDNYHPGFARISATLANQKRLNIKAPSTADINAAVTMTVADRNGGGPVADAAVYALKITDLLLSANRPFETIHKDDKVSVYMGEKYTSIIKEKGFSIGNTNAAGQVIYNFKEQGWYAVIAVKDGFLPAFHRIDITLAGQKPLDVKAPPRKVLMIEMAAEAFVGQAMPIIVREKFIPQRVAAAGLYAIRMEAVTGTIGELLRAEPPETDTPAREKFAAAVKDKGSFLGLTDENGLYLHKFAEAGHYILVAVKDGYAPGFDRINVKPVKPEPAQTK